MVDSADTVCYTGYMKKTLLAYNIFPLSTGNWYLGWWMDAGGRLPEFHSQVFDSREAADAKLMKIQVK
jgi:hypothetical protein